MKVAQWNVLINALLYLDFCFLTASGFLLLKRETIWGINKHMWGDLHTMSSILLILLVLAHLLLHWKWIKCMCKKGSWKLYGVLILGLSIILMMMLSPKTRTKRNKRKFSQQIEYNEKISSDHEYYKQKIKRHH